MSEPKKSLIVIAHDAHDHFLKLYDRSATTVGLIDESSVVIDCLLSGVRIIVARRHDEADTVTIAVGNKANGVIDSTLDLVMEKLSSMDLLRIMEERFARQPASEPA